MIALVLLNIECEFLYRKFRISRWTYCQIHKWDQFSINKVADFVCKLGELCIELLEAKLSDFIFRFRLAVMDSLTQKI